jgi:amino acid transporter
MLAQEELTMFGYIAFAALLFLIPAGLVSAELGGAFSHREGGVYTWVGEAFGRKWGFVAVWLQWIENVVWYPTALAFAAVAVAFTLDNRDLANENVFIGLFCIGAYWGATLIALSGTELLVKVTKAGFVLGTVIPGLVLLGLFAYWIIRGNDLGWDTTSNAAVATDAGGHMHPRWLPNYTGLGTLSFLAGILLLFAGIEVQAVHAVEMRDARRGFPLAILMAAVMAVVMLSLGGLAVAGIVSYDNISLTSGVFDAFDRALTETGGPSVLVPALSLLICYGALGGALAWIRGPARGLLTCAQDGFLPQFLRRTNAKGSERSILLVQGVIVTVISSLYLFLDDVNTAFFLISAITIGTYIVMYMMMYAAAIRLRYTQPNLERQFEIPGGITGMWTIAGLGFTAVAAALVLSFVPPDQLPVGSPATYVILVTTGTVLFTVVPLVITRLAKPSWRAGSSSHPDPSRSTIGRPPTPATPPPTPA